MKLQMTKLSVIAFALPVLFAIHSCTKSKAAPETYPKALSSYSDFKGLVTEIESYREKRLVNLDAFLQMQKESNTIVLDSRSKDRYDKKHLKGAIHLAFTDFTQANLNRLFPDQNTRILIYCNNNFMGDQVNFASKTLVPKKNTMTQDARPIMLALNIPTFINLYGYGFKNIYELDELVNINDNRISLEGTDIVANK